MRLGVERRLFQERMHGMPGIPAMPQYLLGLSNNLAIFFFIYTYRMLHSNRIVVNI